MATNDFSELEAAGNQGLSTLLDLLAARLLEGKKYHELFEARKMQVRQRLGLPLQYAGQADELGDAEQDQLEKGLIAACREVGLLLLRAGEIREGYMYLRPVGERAAVARELAAIEPTEENTEALLEVCLYEGVDLGRGFQILLEKNGTCNAITTYDGLLANRPPADQQAAAHVLVRHVYGELRESLQADIGRQQGAPPQENTVAELIAQRPWLTSSGGYHLDTTHLSAVVRMARVLTDRESHTLALEMCQYGRTLAPELQYQGHEPFVDVYPAHAHFFGALVGENVAAGVNFFRGKAETLNVAEHGTAGLETYIDLLSRLNRPGEALAESLRLMPAGRLGLPNVPTLLELAQRSGEFDRLLAFCRARNDLLGYGAALAAQKLAKQG